ncbi:MAG: glutathione peroxidase [Nesterenkonia sp.]|uniref:glutathione peroxidase n=1 Tax=Nesterenkonia marinintestina TaxID=2979865 RepID=UPI0021C06DCD|nr:glutathione peroxidase [Nesterenkonia sp. GX14115]MDO5492637.1 glutathione peroxidase [Nesterenkonia sp.]
MLDVDRLRKVPLRTLSGEDTTFGDLTGDGAVLVVNVASRCGFTPQYEQLEELQRTYRDHSFTVLGLPSNQFLQEMGSEESIAQTCASRWGVTFPMTEKVRVNGRRAHPLYRTLTDAEDVDGRSGRIRWNFEKFLIAPDGRFRRFGPTTAPDAPELVDRLQEWLS